MSKTERKPREYPEIECPECGLRFKRTRPNRRFCSNRCKFSAWNKANPRVKAAE